jgi:hypothetical protein
MSKLICKKRSKAHEKIRKERKPFPYIRAAKLWAQGRTIAVIAQRSGRIDANNPNDPYHSLRNSCGACMLATRTQTGASSAFRIACHQTR